MSLVGKTISISRNLEGKWIDRKVHIIELQSDGMYLVEDVETGNRFTAVKETYDRMLIPKVKDVSINRQRKFKGDPIGSIATRINRRSQKII